MKRFVDPLFEPYAVLHILTRGGSIMVTCPQCESAAYIEMNQNSQEIQLSCHQCFYRQQHQPDSTYSVAARCSCCERWFNEPLQDERQFTQKYIHFACPFCSEDNMVPIQKRVGYIWNTREVRSGRDPFFDLELYFLDSYRGKLVWALNREHLAYLINYISADLRERPNSGYTRTASYRLPRYMKEAKNRDSLIRLLIRMQHKTN